MQLRHNETRSKAVVVLGMHRSGTSLFTRALNLLGARADNPTGFWEDRGIVDLNERLLAILGLERKSVESIDSRAWNLPAVEFLVAEAIVYLKHHFETFPLWGFKDPRTIRLLPFWCLVLESIDVDVTYLLAIRHPSSVAASLCRRDKIDRETAHTLWLAYMRPILRQAVDSPLVVADYDLFIDDPRAELARLSDQLQLNAKDDAGSEVDEFVHRFLDPTMRHSFFHRTYLEDTNGVAALSQQSYLALYPLATHATRSATTSV